MSVQKMDKIRFGWRWNWI